MNEMTPGQAAYEAWRGDDVASALVPPWAGVGDGDRARWEAGMKAAITTALIAEGLGNIVRERDAARAERNELRELLDEIGVTAANAPEDGDSFGLLEQIAMRIAAVGVPDSTPLEERPDPDNPVTGRTPGAASEARQLHDRAEGLRASLDSLTDRAVAGGIITEEEAAEYRKVTGPGETLREQLTGLREQFENLAAGLALLASSSAPSKKSEIERGCAAAIRGILEHSA